MSGILVTARLVAHYLHLYSTLVSCSCDPQVRAVMGPVLYMLEAYEELFSKELDRLVEEVLRYIMCTLYVYNTNIHQSII